MAQVSRHLALFKSKKRASGERRAPATSTSSILCEESLVEAAARCTAPLFHDIQKALAVQSIQHPSRTPLRDACDSVDPWLVSYVSRDSFTANKNYGGLFRSPSVDMDRLLRSTLSSPQFYRFISTRGFKTDRTVVSELERNPNMWQRFKKAMGTYSFISLLINFLSNVLYLNRYRYGDWKAYTGAERNIGSHRTHHLER